MITNVGVSRYGNPWQSQWWWKCCSLVWLRC